MTRPSASVVDQPLDIGLLRLRFEQAAHAASGVSERLYRIAGHRVTMRFAGGALVEKLTPAFAHLADSSAAEPELILNVWDSASTGTEPPPLPPIERHDNSSGALYHHKGSRARFVYQPRPNALSLLEAGRGMSWYWVADADDLPYWECAAPFRQILYWWLSEHGCQQVHGAAVGSPSGGVLLVGKAGSGKSTASLATIGSQLAYAGDDYVAVSVEPVPWVHSLYNSGKIEPDDVSRFPRLFAAVSNPEDLRTEKAVTYVHDHFPGSTTRGFPLRAILIPRVTARATPRIVESSSFAALAALAPSTIFQLHTAGQEALATLARLVGQVPSFFLDLGSEISSIPLEIARFLSELDSSSSQ